MAIPQDVMAHMHDNKHPDSAPVCLQHLLDLWAHAVTAFALEHHPDTAKIGQPWSPTDEEAVTLNAMLIEVREEHLKTHKHAWFKEVSYIIDTMGETTIEIPDEHQYVMDYLISLRDGNPDLIHSAIPRRVTHQ